jgi:alpha-D-xyloside xylohydrolase
VRSTREADFPSENWALDAKPPALTANVQQHEDNHTINNGNITASVSPGGKLKFTNQHGKLVLSEIFRSRVDGEVGYCSALRFDAREFKPRLGTESWHVKVRFESLDEDEKIYGMGQYQQSCLNLKGCDLELAHRNSQASVPFALSSLGFGFMWNNPTIGRAVFGRNQTTFEADSTRIMDYWVVVGDTPQEIVRAYTAVTGRPPEMPEYGLGFLQAPLPDARIGPPGGEEAQGRTRLAYGRHSR